MNLTHLHLMLNHIPILGSFVLFFFLLYAIIKKNDETVNKLTYFYLLMTFFALIVYLTGEPAAGIVRNFKEINRELIEEHELWGLISFILIALSGILSLINILFKSKELYKKKYFRFILLVIAFITIISISTAGWLGGEIRHIEIKANVTPVLDED